MNFPSLAGLGLPSTPRIGRIAVPPGWVCEHAVIIEAGLGELEADDEEDGGDLEIVFEPDFSLEDDDAPRGVLFERDEDDEEDDWPP